MLKCNNHKIGQLISNLLMTSIKLMDVIIIVFVSMLTVWRKILMGENIDEFDKFPAIRQYFPYQNFPFS